MFYCPVAGGRATRLRALPPRDHPPGSRDQHGRRHIGDDQVKLLVIVGFLTLPPAARWSYRDDSSLGDIGIEALTGFLAAFINVRISAPVVAGHRFGRHLRCGCDRAAGCNARSTRRSTRWTPWPSARVEYLVSTCSRSRDDRHHPVVLDRGHPLFGASKLVHGRRVRAVGRSVQPLLLDLPQPHGSVGGRSFRPS